MAEQAANLVEFVLPWVLTVPHRLRSRLAFDSDAVTIIRRSGSGLQLDVHAHALVLDGVFTEAAGGTLRFHPAPAPTDVEVARLVTTIRTRVLRLLRRRGVFVEAEDENAPDRLAETSLALAGIASAAVQGRSALGRARLSSSGSRAWRCLDPGTRDA